MADTADIRRHSLAADAEIIKDPQAAAEREAANGLRQFDLVKRMVRDAVEPDRPFKFRLSMFLALHREALEGLDTYAGNFRPSDVEIGKSKHVPPKAHLVAELVEALCDYVNDNWNSQTPVHLCAYVMWRLNWIHPFKDGNGRTSRAASYLVLCARSGYLLPGENTIPDQISASKQPYYDALEKADEAWKANVLDLTDLEALIGTALATQLADYYKAATGRT